MLDPLRPVRHGRLLHSGDGGCRPTRGSSAHPRAHPEVTRLKRTLVLASSSAIRQKLMAHLGLEFMSARPVYIERDLALPPEEESLAHARGKVESVASQFLDSIIIGSDQLLFWAGERHRKPMNEPEVIAQLLELRGIEHHLFTSLVVRDMLRQETLEHVVDSTLVVDGALTERQIRRYARQDTPVGCAGGYRLEGLGISLFSRISSSDASAILGMPMMALCRFLRDFGISIP